MELWGGRRERGNPFCFIDPPLPQLDVMLEARDFPILSPFLFSFDVDSRSTGRHHQAGLVINRTEAVENAANLTNKPPDGSDDTVVSRLRERFLTDDIYTAIRASALAVAIPHNHVPSHPNSVFCKCVARVSPNLRVKDPLPVSSTSPMILAASM